MVSKLVLLLILQLSLALLIVAHAQAPVLDVDGRCVKCEDGECEELCDSTECRELTTELAYLDLAENVEVLHVATEEEMDEKATEYCHKVIPIEKSCYVQSESADDTDNGFDLGFLRRRLKKKKKQGKGGNYDDLDALPSLKIFKTSLGYQLGQVLLTFHDTESAELFEYTKSVSGVDSNANAWMINDQTVWTDYDGGVASIEEIFQLLTEVQAEQITVTSFSFMKVILVKASITLNVDFAIEEFQNLPIVELADYDGYIEQQGCGSNPIITFNDHCAQVELQQSDCTAQARGFLLSNSNDEYVLTGMVESCDASSFCNKPQTESFDSFKKCNLGLETKGVQCDAFSLESVCSTSCDCEWIKIKKDFSCADSCVAINYHDETGKKLKKKTRKQECESSDKCAWKRNMCIDA